MVKNSLCISFLISSVLLCGCANDFSGERYSASNAGEIQQTSLGIIISKRPVKIEGENGVAGALLGAAGGGLAGSMFGKGKGKNLTTAVGAIAGGVAGNAIQNRAVDGFEYTVKLESGQIITVAQGVDPPLAVNQRVYVINSHQGRSRIGPA
ncbi:MAG: glycine zipper 2TM domain-containing protein [Holosporales bacterium]|jgi:outer membrane lipoprotein SlyB|nr:glycine zipper 2TM domain-containing protein [Holosporales bacterium]